MSGSMSSRGPGGKRAALFKSPTFSSNSEANTEEGRLMEAACSSSLCAPGGDIPLPRKLL
uniref:Uncharacterized protein n=1 Tax=Haplochromis burtoni TaxID=8153 RepID=A0A3Q2V4U7_HAPBU